MTYDDTNGCTYCGADYLPGDKYRTNHLGRTIHAACYDGWMADLRRVSTNKLNTAGDRKRARQSLVNVPASIGPVQIWEGVVAS